MKSVSPALDLRHYGPKDAVAMEDVIAPIYASTHAHLIGVDPWNAPEKWWERLIEIYAKTRDFDLVVGSVSDGTAGYAFGSPSDKTTLWEGITNVLPDLHPSGSVYIFREFAVRPDLQRRGFGRLIHDELLRGRPERAAHLLLRKDNHAARAAYKSWGWIPAGELQPFPDSETFDAMALDMANAFGGVNPKGITR